ncbi:sigma 54-interacting transcriptional regulator, partial [Staphylococcus pseudintermedius]
MTQTPQLSVVVPVFNEQDNVAPLVQEITAALRGVTDFEIVYVDDHSRDGTLAALEALKAGAFDFVAKPVDLSVLRDLVRHALELHETRRSASEAVGSRLYGESPAMIKLRQTIGKVARSQAPVYIAGESGVGKELVARTIHSEGGRADGPFVPVNCGAIPA